MSDAIGLQPHGRHSTDYTLQVGHAFSEAVRVLNYGTYADQGLRYPSTAGDIVGLVRGGVGMGQRYHLKV